MFPGLGFHAWRQMQKVTTQTACDPDTGLVEPSGTASCNFTCLKPGKSEVDRKRQLLKVMRYEIMEFDCAIQMDSVLSWGLVRFGVRVTSVRVNA